MGIVHDYFFYQFALKRTKPVNRRHDVQDCTEAQVAIHPRFKIVKQLLRRAGPALDCNVEILAHTTVDGRRRPAKIHIVLR